MTCHQPTLTVLPAGGGLAECVCCGRLQHGARGEDSGLGGRGRYVATGYLHAMRGIVVHRSMTSSSGGRSYMRRPRAPAGVVAVGRPNKPSEPAGPAVLLPAPPHPCPALQPGLRRRTLCCWMAARSCSATRTVSAKLLGHWTPNCCGCVAKAGDSGSLRPAAECCSGRSGPVRCHPLVPDQHALLHCNALLDPAACAAPSQLLLRQPPQLSPPPNLCPCLPPRRRVWRPCPHDGRRHAGPQGGRHADGQHCAGRQRARQVQGVK